MKVATITGTDGRHGSHLRLIPETIGEAAALVFCALSKFVPKGATDLILRPESSLDPIELRVYLSTPPPVDKDPDPATTRDALDRTP